MAMELIGSLFRYANDAEMTKQFKGLGHAPSQEICKWISIVKDNISEHLDSEVKTLFYESYLNITFIQQIVINHNLSTLPELIPILIKSTAEDYIKNAYAFLQLEDNADEKRIKAMILDIHDKKTASIIYELIKNPVETVERLTAVVRKFYDLFFEPFQIQIEKIIAERIDYFSNLYNEDHTNFFTKIIGMEMPEVDADVEIRIIVSHYNEACLTCQKYPEQKLYLLTMGYQIEDILSETAVKKKQTQIFKILSDEKRLKILKLTCKKRYYGNELAKELNISTATVSYHMSKLFELGIMNLEDGEFNRIYYKANIEKLKTLLENVYNDIISKDDSNEKK